MGVNTVTHWVNVQKRGLEFSAPSLDLIHTLGTGLSLRAGGQGFSPATKRVAPGYFYWKIEEK